MNKRNPKVTTPKGIAVWPWLNEPDRKFNANGEYKVNLQMAHEDAQPFIEKLQEIHKEHYQETCKREMFLMMKEILLVKCRLSLN